jgi:hypothetical protein
MIFAASFKAGRLSEIRGFGPAIEKKMSAALEGPPAAKRAQAFEALAPRRPAARHR